jgi:predicted nucleotidyltransferase
MLPAMTDATAPALDEELIEKIVQLLVEAAHPRRIILFGSYARGEQTPDSDLDLLVIEEQVENRAAEMVRLRAALKPIYLPFDVVVHSEKDVTDPRLYLGTAVYDALTAGRTIYAS